MEPVWRTQGNLGDIKSTIQLLDLGGEYVLEFTYPEELSFKQRLINSIKYLFRGSSIKVGQAFIDEESIKRLKKVL